MPAIAWQPGKSRTGVTNEITASFDLFPTFLQLAGLPNRDLDGESMAWLLYEGGEMTERTLFWRMRDRRAVRRGPWKLVSVGENEPELYNLGTDVGETSDLASDQPELVEELLSAMARWEENVGR